MGPAAGPHFVCNGTADLNRTTTIQPGAHLTYYNENLIYGVINGALTIRLCATQDKELVPGEWDFTSSLHG